MKEETSNKNISNDFFKGRWDESWVYIKTVVDVVHEPIIILDKNLHVLTANNLFYQTFQVAPCDTEGKSVYTLGNGQWDVPNLRILLKKVLSYDTIFSGFEISHTFPSIGHKIMMLSARQVHCQKKLKLKDLFPIIIISFTDITEMVSIAESLARQM